jgi:hypothetical protein
MLPRAQRRLEVAFGLVERRWQLGPGMFNLCERLGAIPRLWTKLEGRLLTRGWTERFTQAFGRRLARRRHGPFPPAVSPDFVDRLLGSRQVLHRRPRDVGRDRPIRACGPFLSGNWPLRGRFELNDLAGL